MGVALTIRKRIASKFTSRSGPDKDVKAPKGENDEQNLAIYHSDGIPNADQCRVHLKLMKVFAHVREDICQQDGLFGIYKKSVDTSSNKAATGIDANLSHDRQQDQRWQSYVARAAMRFEHWWRSCASRDETENSYSIDRRTCSKDDGLASLLEKIKPMQWSEHDLPPIDVLMALHSFMLNPRCFLEDCIRFQMLPLWKAGLPWALLDKVIEDGVYEYKPSDAARSRWKEQTRGRPWNNTDDSHSQHLACPACAEPIAYNCSESPFVLWTGIPESDTGSVYSNLVQIRCPSDGCGAAITPDLFAVRKMRQSIEGLSIHPTTLQGTLLTPRGLVKSLSQSGAIDLINLIESDANLRTDLLSYLRSQEAAILGINSENEHKRASSQENQGLTSLTSIRAHIKQTLEKQLTQDSAGSEHEELPPLEEIHKQHRVLNAASRWLESTSHPSMFSLDIASAIVRQGSFVKTMHSLAWLYNPALDLTLSRILFKYQIFIEIIAKNPSNVAVPTHAVDLAWHTHQLSPATYYEYTVRVTGTHRGSQNMPSSASPQAEFIDHDDKISETVRDGAFEWTGVTYESIVLGKDKYSECMCWDCMTKAQVIADQDRQRKFSRRKADVDALPNSQVEKEASAAVAKAQYYKLEDDYARAVRNAKKTGKSTIKQEDFLNGYEWLYPAAKPILGAP